MYLTQENAAEFLGKTLDAKRRMGHYYPLIVGKYPSGSYYVRDRVGVCMPVPQKQDFNSHYFDIVDGIEFERCEKLKEERDGNKRSS